MLSLFKRKAEPEADPDPYVAPPQTTGTVQFAVKVLGPGGGGNGATVYLGQLAYEVRGVDPAAISTPATNAAVRHLAHALEQAAKRITPAEAHMLAESEGLEPGEYALVPIYPEA